MTDAVISGLIEEFMPEVAEIAAELCEGDIPEEDLIQEGYVGLMEGVRLLREEDPDLLPLSVEETIRGAIRGSILKAMEAYNSFSVSGDRLVAQVELLSKSIERLTEELGTRPNIDEIANDMQIPQEKVLEIIKLTGSDPEVPDEAFYPQK